MLSWQLANVKKDISCFNVYNWYNDYRNIVHELEPGKTYQVTVETSYTDTFLAIWIDFNDDLYYHPMSFWLTSIVQQEDSIRLILLSQLTPPWRKSCA